MNTNEIRSRFLAYFKSRQHTVVASDSLIPLNDPTLLFTGAGMNQFKEFFLGIKKDYVRATSSQKCLRTGDLENVGKTAYHHTFFEMLGNFSFGDYFKKEAIVWAWDFLTRELGIPQERLRVSVHRDDTESYTIWKDEVKLPENIIYRFGDKDNFWPSNAPLDGPNGPCGPCSEIFFDQGSDAYVCTNPECSPACNCGRFAEIWNLVFTQYERQDGGVLVPLPSKNIDTGMGLERIACVMQGKRTNFEIDIFQSTIDAILVACKKSREELPTIKPSVYAITDHIRTAVFSIADGAYPSNEGRGYVIRKLIRRSVWHADTLGIKHLFLALLVPIVIDMFKSIYPELTENQKHITQIVDREESRFRSTLDDGRKMLEDLIARVKKEKSSVIPGFEVFRLYDTYGFPDELTRMRAEEDNLVVDQAGFDSCMEDQRLKAKNSTEISGAIFTSSVFEKFIAQFEKTLFCGYSECEKNVTISAIYSNDAACNALGEGERGILIFDVTPFYAESGGQVGDTGSLKNKITHVDVLSTQKKDDVYYHDVIVKKGTVNVHDHFCAVVNMKRRTSVMKNHTATHLLQAALRTVLGEHVRQLGSLVSEEKLRFDFAYPQAMTKEQLQRVELFVNSKIDMKLSLQTELTTVKAAKEKGALAFFGDRYGEAVRLVSIDDVSKELCGGIHCTNTADIEDFFIVSESSIASGIRRIEAVTGHYAAEYKEQIALKKIDEENKKRAKIKAEEEKQQYINSLKSNDVVDAILATKRAIGEYSLISYHFCDIEQNGLRDIYDVIKNKVSRSIVVFIAENEDRLAIMVALTGDLSKTNLSANAIVQELNKCIDGKGGGKQLMAFSGGKRVMSPSELINKLPAIIGAQN
jgi:alanyl-tRNA synthetase